MARILIVVDMQKDFIDGSLGTPEAVRIVEPVRRLAEGWDGRVLFTRDTHTEEYLDTQEGRSLPVAAHGKEQAAERKPFQPRREHHRQQHVQQNRNGEKAAFS